MLIPIFRPSFASLPLPTTTISSHIQELHQQCQTGGILHENLIRALFTQNNTDFFTLQFAIAILVALPDATKAALPLFEGACDDYVNLVLASTCNLIAAEHLTSIWIALEHLAKSDPFEYLNETTKENWYLTLRLILATLPEEIKAHLPFEASSCTSYIWAIKDSMERILENGSRLEKAGVLTRLDYLSNNDNLPLVFKIEFMNMKQRSFIIQLNAKL